jgi:hypothetical protein
MTPRQRDPGEPQASEAYLRLLKGEISSKDFVRVVEKSVSTNKRQTKRAARRAATADG